MAVIRRKKRGGSSSSILGSFIDDGSIMYGGYYKGGSSSKGISVRRVIVSILVTIVLLGGAIMLYEMDSGFRAVRDKHRIINKHHRSVIRTGQQQHNINNKNKHMLLQSTDSSINQQQQQIQMQIQKRQQSDVTEVDEAADEQEQEQQSQEKEHDLIDGQEREEEVLQNGNMNNKTQQQQEQQDEKEQQQLEQHDDKVYNKSVNLTDVELQNQMSKPPLIPTETTIAAIITTTTTTTNPVKTRAKSITMPVPDTRKQTIVTNVVPVDESDTKNENQGPKQIADKDSTNGTTTTNNNNEHRYYAIEIDNLALSNTSTISSGTIVIETYPEWAPIGVQHLHMLLEEQFYIECRFFRVLPNFMVQFGINGNPEIQKKLSKPKHKILDDINQPIHQSNVRGTISYAMSGNNTRTTQLFINTNIKDNKYLDSQGFVPVAKVLYNGMETIIDHIYSDAREQPQQSKIQQYGNIYLNKEFPQLSYIKSIQQLVSLSNYNSKDNILLSSSNNNNTNIHNNSNNSTVITNTT